MIDEGRNEAEEDIMLRILLLNFKSYIMDKLFQKLLIYVALLPFEIQNLHSIVHNFPLKLDTSL